VSTRMSILKRRLVTSMLELPFNSDGSVWRSVSNAPRLYNGTWNLSWREQMWFGMSQSPSMWQC
jgi:hypothetical protein